MALLMEVAWSIFNLIFNLYMSALGFSNAIIGAFNALPAVGILLVGLPVGALADRLGYRIFMLVAAAATLGGSLLLGLAPQRLTALLGAGAFALGDSVIALLAVPMLAQLSRPPERVPLYSVNTALAWVGGLGGSLVGGFVPELAVGVVHAPAGSAPALRTAFLVMALLQAVTVPFIVRLAAAPSLQRAQQLPLRQLAAVDWRRFTRLLIPQLILGTAAGMFLNFLQLYLAQRFHLPPGPIGLVMALTAAVTAATTLAAPSIGRRVGMVMTIGVMPVLGAPLVLGLALTNVLGLALALIVVRQAVLNLQEPLSQVFGMEYVAEGERARLGTAQILAFGLGYGGIGPLVSGFLQVQGGYQLAFSVAAAFYLLAGVTFLALFRRVGRV